MIELLKRLAIVDSELCQSHTEDGITYYTISGCDFCAYQNGDLAAINAEFAAIVRGDLAAWWLQGVLQQAIEMRGWPYVVSWNREDYYARVGNYPAETVEGYRTAAEALLAAYVAAAESEER